MPGGVAACRRPASSFSRCSVAKSRLLSQLNNHFGLYLYGKQIVDGVKPFWDGSDPYMVGNIAVWTAARQRAIDEAAPKIIERLRPAYGRM